MAARKRTADERDDEVAAAEAANITLTTIIGNRKKGSKARPLGMGPINAPEEDGILLTGTIRGLWSNERGELCIVTSVTGQCYVVTVNLAVPSKRVRKPISGRHMYVDPLVFSGKEMFFGGLLYRGTHADLLEGASFHFERGIHVLMAIATFDAGYLVGVTKASQYAVGGSSGPERLRVVRLTPTSCSEWQQGDAATASWMEPLAALLGPPVDDLPSWKRFSARYEQLRGIFHLAHQRAAPFGATISITMHLNDYPDDVVDLNLYEMCPRDKLPGLLLPGVVCTISQRGVDSAEGRIPRANTKHSCGLVVLATGEVVCVEARCVRLYSGHYAPFGTTDGATTLPDLPRE